MSDTILSNKLILAPMVRANTLPFRLLCLKYDADIVFSEEIIDKKIINTKRIINPIHNTIDYILNNNQNTQLKPNKKKKKHPGAKSVLRIDPLKEENKLIFQMGTSNSQYALLAAEKVINDVYGIDINMGCPKSFSIKGGMGVALLSTPEISHDIITTLKRNFNCSISCKIRLLDTIENTIEYVRRMEHAGVSAITVHLRNAEEKVTTIPAHWEHMKTIVDSVNIPVIANGDFFFVEDWRNFLLETGCSSIMLSRPALWNPSIFRYHSIVNNINNNNNIELPHITKYNMMNEYLTESFRLNNHPVNTKYVLNEMVVSGRYPTRFKRRLVETFSNDNDNLFIPNHKILSQAKSIIDIAKLFNRESDYNNYRQLDEEKKKKYIDSNNNNNDNNNIIDTYDVNHIYSDSYFDKLRDNPLKRDIEEIKNDNLNNNIDKEENINNKKIKLN